MILKLTIELAIREVLQRQLAQEMTPSFHSRRGIDHAVMVARDVDQPHVMLCFEVPQEGKEVGVSIHNRLKDFTCRVDVNGSWCFPRADIGAQPTLRFQ